MPHGGSLPIGHPFATGAPILSQAAKEPTPRPSATHGVGSLCVDGGQGTVALLQRVWCLPEGACPCRPATSNFRVRPVTRSPVGSSFPTRPCAAGR
nr:hypothetical protein [Rhodanobacter glycinis]